ncbi:response regulator [Hyalangium rubrum]|uniref:Response regulator n=1 Tax=Hyalangium rubrum TaxID=3103134 RepID=A0ABU5H6D8_9BACT|nr:response regulator [Hyalangium sp. s54d21]MDY7228697.1 response regulator [Hyalangium sp. s54d21]
MRKRRILVIDDSEAIHQDVARILCPQPPGGKEELEELEEEIFGPLAPSKSPSRHVFELDSAYQGQEGLEKVRQALAAGRPYALVLLDYRMPPGWNGFETLQRLLEVAPSLPIVLCSAYSDYSWEEIVRELGWPQQLIELRKPFNQKELYQLVVTLTEPHGVISLD